MPTLLLLLLSPVLGLPVNTLHLLEDTTEFILGISCTAESIHENGRWDKRRIHKCGDCWDSMSDRDSFSEEGEILREEGLTGVRTCVTQFLPDMEEVCRKELDTLKVGTTLTAVFRCFKNHVLGIGEVEEVMESVMGFVESSEEEAETSEEDEEASEKEEEISEEAASEREISEAPEEYKELLDEFEDELPMNYTSGEDLDDYTTDFIIGTSCTIESQDEGGQLDEARIEECGQCWENIEDALSETGLPLAKACVAEYLPNIDTACQHLITNLQVGDIDKAKETFACFLDYVKQLDLDGEVQAGVAKYLRESVDMGFVVGITCTISAMAEDGSFDESRIEECVECLREATQSVTEEGLDMAKQCGEQYMPDIILACKDELDLLHSGDEEQSAKTLSCFYDYVQDHDIDEAIQMRVRDNIDASKFDKNLF